MSEPDPPDQLPRPPAPAPRQREEPFRAGHFARRLGLVFASILGTNLAWATLTSVGAHAWTWVQLGLSGLAVTLAVMLVLVLPHRRTLRGVALVLALAGLSRVAWAAFPWRGLERPRALVQTRFVHSPPDTRLWCQGVPERETMNLGAWVGLSPREQERNGSAIDAAYAEIERGDLFERAESPLLDSWGFDHEHYWLAVPEKHDGPTPLIVFVHGNGGTFQLYPHLLARAAVARGFAIAFLSHGMGIWNDARDAAARIGRVVDAVAREVPVDRGHVALVGLSAGGPAVFGAALREPGKYRAVVAVSAVFPELESSSDLRRSRVLILHGTDDPRAGINDARRARDDLLRAGVAVELDEQAGEDHLAILTARERWVPRIMDWLARE